MFGPDSSVQAVPYTGPPTTPPGQPPSEQRVVESTAKATLQQHQTGSMSAQPPSALKDLANSARRFAEILDSTGSIVLASVASGFRVGHVDVYA